MRASPSPVDFRQGPLRLRHQPVCRPHEFENYVTGRSLHHEAAFDRHHRPRRHARSPASPTPRPILQDLPSATRPSGSTPELSYVQFARIGLGLQRSHIGQRHPASTPLPPASFDVPATTLFGSLRLRRSGHNALTVNLCTELSSRASSASRMTWRHASSSQHAQTCRVALTSHGASPAGHTNFFDRHRHFAQSWPSATLRSGRPVVRPACSQTSAQWHRGQQTSNSASAHAERPCTRLLAAGPAGRWIKLIDRR